MTEKTLDIIGGMCWILVFLMPLISTFLVWRFIRINKLLRIVIGLLIGFFFSLIFYCISLGIIFRDGLGPG